MKVLVAMSGGVDSAVAAYLLKKQGHDVVGMTLRVHDDPQRLERTKTCCAPSDMIDAREVALSLDIPYYAVDMREEFRKQVIEPFAKEYLSGRTPNPCVLCNSKLKFGDLFSRAKALGLDVVATGHYARLRKNESGKIELLRGVDSQKDQSYFLFGLTQEQLAHTMFPLGDLTKEEVRNIAKEAGIPIANKPESQEICFVPQNDYAKVVAETFPEKSKQCPAGAFIDQNGKKLGEHQGIHHYTVGQRRGLGLHNPRPLYVTKINAEKHEVVVGEQDQLLGQKMNVSEVNWIDPNVASETHNVIQCDVAIRYRHPAAPAQIRLLQNQISQVEFNDPQRAISPGQAAVFYHGDVVLGGGWIS